MELFLIRHAEAVALGEQGITNDEDRPLTEVGIVQASKLGIALQVKGIQFDRVFTSPLVRARQTAEYLAPAWSPAPEIELWPELAPGGKRRRVAKLLQAKDWQRVALIGHQPDLGNLTAWLIGSKEAQIDLAKSGLAVVKVTGNPGKSCGTLKMLLTPAWVQITKAAEPS